MYSAIDPIEKPLSQNDRAFPGITGDDDDGCKSHGMTMPPPAADATAAAALTLLQAQLQQQQLLVHLPIGPHFHGQIFSP